jgi:predicted Zn-dependent protease
MKRWVPFALILVLAVAALVASEAGRLRVPIGPRALIYWWGGTSREGTRVPARIMRLSDDDEIALGDRLAHGYSRATATNDRAMQSYVELVGLRLALHATRKLPYQFHYISDPTFENAFALPGGHVFIGAGLIAQMKTEDELAWVLAHEVEHVDRYHCAERVEVEARARDLGILGAIAALPVELFMAGYSKQQELEADAEGLRLAVLSGYSPYGAQEVMKRFTNIHERGMQDRAAGNPVGEVARVPGQALSEYFESHPGGAERVACINELIERQHWQNRVAQKPLRARVGERQSGNSSGVALDAGSWSAMGRSTVSAISKAARSLPLRQLASRPQSLLSRPTILVASRV